MAGSLVHGRWPRRLGCALVLWLLVTAQPLTAGKRVGMRTKVVPRYYDIFACSDKPSGLTIHNTTHYIAPDGSELVDGWVSMDIPIKAMKELTITIHRCTGGTAAGQCEYFTRWHWTAALCMLTDAKGMVWSPLIDSSYPRFKCPIAPGVYHFRNASLDMQSLDYAAAQMQLDKYIWPMEAQITNEKGELAVCFVGTTEVRRVRIRD